MLIKGIKKHGRTVYVRDRATEKFEVIGRFVKSDDFKVWASAFMLGALIIGVGLIANAIWC